MKAKNFDNLVKLITQRTKDTLTHKAADYATALDRLHNFKEAARLRPDQTPISACLGMQLKHTVSCEDIKRGLLEGKTYELSYVLEKFLDHANYDILLIALALDAGLIEEDI